MESESGTTNTKISDSGYSNSCSNSNSQRSASSKSRHSGSNSSRSSGYCGATNQDGSVDAGPQPPKRNKDKEHKKKKTKTAPTSTSSNTTTPTEVKASTVLLKDAVLESTMGVEALPVALETATPASEKLEKVTEKPGDLDTNIAETAPASTDIADEQVITDWNKDIDVKDDNVEMLNVNDAPDGCIKTDVCRPEDGFCCIVSMYDGVVLYTTPSLTSALGFPKDMWLGRSFIDFVHPKDRETFSSQVTLGVALPLVDIGDAKNCLYVCLRKYRGLKSSGYGVVEKAVSYQAFKLTVTFKHVAKAPESKYIDNNSNMFLIVVAVPVYSSYKVPQERRRSAKFGMRHTAACIFSHVDADVVTNFGFLPQDLLGKSVFDFYHPEDMPFLKEVYESVINLCQIAGSVFKSKPYRFAVQNGGFAMIETEWSSFINPWSRRLEFVIGVHRVLQGPLNSDIFDIATNNETKHISEEVLKESKIIQGEILLLLNKEFSRPSEIAKHEVSKRCKDLANFMETLMDEVNRSNLQLDLPQDPDPTISERDSVMLGEISPHHEYYDSKSSSDTPPSYNQLNYNENIQRFFQSKPKTTVSDESVERSNLQSTEMEQENKNVSSGQECATNQKCLSPVETSGASGSGSAGNLSSGSNLNMESGTSHSITNTSNDSYKPPHLTEAILCRHNEDMEKIMVKKHKEQRSCRESKKNYHKIEKIKFDGKIVGKPEDFGHLHGIKRSGSHSWEADSHKVSKHKHQSDPISTIYGVNQPKVSTTSKPVNQQPQSSTSNRLTSNENNYQSGINDVNLWPPFSVSVTPMSNTHANGLAPTPGAGPCFATAGMFPVYYFPTPQRPPAATDYMDPGLASRYQVQYMPGMIYNYNPILPTSPIYCSPLPVFPVPVAPSMQPEQHPNGRHVAPSASNTNIGITSTERKPRSPGEMSNTQFQRPASQATSVKAEPGSVMGSIASASVANKNNNKEINKNQIIRPKQATIDEESSYSSSYSSFLKTDPGSGSNDDSNLKNNTSDENCWHNKKKYFPVRKRDPPWMEAVDCTPDLIYRYQVAVKGLEDILASDLNVLKDINQPVLVNDQLNQLYVEMELEGLSTKLTLEEGFTSSSSSGDEITNASERAKKKRRSYSSLMMIYEENAPLPPPNHS